MLKNVWEIIGGKKVIFQPPHQATWFRAFPTLADGVAHHLDFLRNHRYKASWSAVDAGNPAAFAHLLKVAGYYTAPEADYIKLMNVYFNKFM
jgi:flagellar protein FlgJ